MIIDMSLIKRDVAFAEKCMQDETLVAAMSSLSFKSGEALLDEKLVRVICADSPALNCYLWFGIGLCTSGVVVLIVWQVMKRRNRTPKPAAKAES
jgi:hypothetical protein